MGVFFVVWTHPVEGEELESLITEGMVLIPGGTFKRGCDSFGPQHGAPEQKVHLDAFWIDKFEVTNKKF